MSTGTTYNEILQKMADEYFLTTGQESASAHEIAVWAIRSNRWEAPPDLVLQKCKEDFAKAMREQYISDEMDRPVRAKHAARIRRGQEQLYLWADIRTASRKHMEIAFNNRREQIVGDCRQLSRDVTYYNNSNLSSDDPIQMLFDFTEDVHEDAFSGEFQPQS